MASERAPEIAELAKAWVPRGEEARVEGAADEGVTGTEAARSTTVTAAASRSVRAAPRSATSMIPSRPAFALCSIRNAMVVLDLEPPRSPTSVLRSPVQVLVQESVQEVVQGFTPPRRAVERRPRPGFRLRWVVASRWL